MLKSQNFLRWHDFSNDISENLEEKRRLLTAYNFIKMYPSALVFSCEFCKNFWNNFSQNIPGEKENHIRTHIVWKVSILGVFVVRIFRIWTSNTDIF